MGRVGLGVVLPQAEITTPGPHDVLHFAAEAERLGFDHLLAFEHVLGADPTTRPDWTGYYDHTDPFLEPLVLFAFLGARTTLDFVTDVLVLPQRQTALVAKQAATLAILLEGRLRLGVGIGWNAVEYAGLGVDFGTRARRFEEQLGLLRALWQRPSVDHDGRFDRIDRAGIAPRPPGPVPLWLGCGASPSALRRVGELADGWIPHPELGTGSRVRAAWAQVREAAEAAGRDPSALGLQGQVSLAATGFNVDPAVQVERWLAMGATHVGVNPLRCGLVWPEGHLDAVRTAAEKLAPLVEDTP